MLLKVSKLKAITWSQCREDSYNLCNKTKSDCSWNSYDKKYSKNVSGVTSYFNSVLLNEITLNSEFFWKLVILACGKIKHKLRIASRKFRYRAYEFHFRHHEFKTMSYEFLSTSYEFKFRSYKFKSTKYKKKARFGR